MAQRRKCINLFSVVTRLIIQQDEVVELIDESKAKIWDVRNTRSQKSDVRDTIEKEDDEGEDKMTGGQDGDELEERLANASRLKELNRRMSSEIGAATRYINKVRKYTNVSMPDYE